MVKEEEEEGELVRATWDEEVGRGVSESNYQVSNINTRQYTALVGTGLMEFIRIE